MRTPLKIIALLALILPGLWMALGFHRTEPASTPPSLSTNPGTPIATTETTDGADSHPAATLDTPSARARALRALVARGSSQWTTHEYGLTTHHEFIALYPAWLKDDLELASRAIVGMPADWDRREFLALAMEAWMTQRPNSAVDYVHFLRQDQELFHDAVLRYITVRAADDPVAVAEWLEEPASGALSERAAGELAVRWSEEDPTAALAWAQALPEGPARNRATLKAAQNWIRQDPDAAVSHVQALPGVQQHDTLRAAMARSFMEQDSEGALAWARSIQEPGLRRRILIEAVAPISRHQPAVARALADELQLSTEGRNALAVHP